MIELTPERLALIRGEGRPNPQRPTRLIRGVSEEADALRTLLERNGGARSVRALVQETGLGAWATPAAVELEDLGLAERFGEGETSSVRLTPAAAGVMLLSSWSMRG